MYFMGKKIIFRHLNMSLNYRGTFIKVVKINTERKSAQIYLTRF